MPIGFTQWGGLGASCSLLGFAFLLPSAPPPKKKPLPQPSFSRDVAPVVAKYCGACHGGNNPAAGLNLTKLIADPSVSRQKDLWAKVAMNVGSMHMPPDGAAKPSERQRKQLLSWIQQASKACDLHDPGHVTLHRLNREEYNNTVRDLLGVNFRPADDFPSDDVGYGFDNIGDVLSVSPLLMEKYLSAAEQIAQKAIVVPPAPIKIVGADLPPAKGAANTDSNEREMYTSAQVSVSVRLPRAGVYHIRIQAFGDQAGPEPPHMELKRNGSVLTVFDVTARRSESAKYEVPFTSQGGNERIQIAFTNDFYDPKLPAGQNDRNLYIKTVEVIGPLAGADGVPAFQMRLIPQPPTPENRRPMARQILQSFATRAFRRPASSEEVDRLMRVFDFSEKAQEPFESGIQLAVEATLASPNFLFRVETDPNPGSGAHAINDYELASRLSYFLWSTMPDEELFSLAAEHKLHKPSVLDAQVHRMLKDPKAHALADNFAGQWLQLRKLATVNPDPGKYPDFNDALRRSMVTETKMFFQAVVDEDRSVLDFIDGKFTFINGPLAKHYGISGVHGDAFERVNLKGDERGGVLTQASVLTVTSNPTRTSPVKRGKWVLEQLLGTPPPPPPPGVGTLGDERKILDAKTLRARMEQHRAKPMCAACHSKMDPIGFGLENYDAVGAWRTVESGAPIDSSGVLPDGRKFAGPAQLKRILLANKSQFERCLAEKMLTYALGRGMESNDSCALDAIVKKTEIGDRRFSSLVTAVVNSDPFLQRRGDK